MKLLPVKQNISTTVTFVYLPKGDLLFCTKFAYFAQLILILLIPISICSHALNTSEGAKL